MPQRTLPNELLSSLFELITSPNDLAQLSYSCKTFSLVVKPLLYSHVKIKTRHHRLAVSKIKEEHVELIKEVSILGNANVWDQNVKHLDVHFDGKDKTKEKASASEEGEEEEMSRVCRLGAGCVRELFEGKLFKLDSIQSIVVRDIHEQPRIELSKPQVQVSLTENLHTLTILTHRGGAHLWESVLKKKNLPSLRQLTIYDITTFTSPGETAPPQFQSDGQTLLSFGRERMGEGGGGIDEFVVTEIVLSKTDLLDQLEILVSAEYPVLRKKLKLAHLAIIAEDAFISDKTKYAVIHVGNNVFQTDSVDNVFIYLGEIVNPLKKNKNKKCSLEYVSVGSWAYEMSDIFDEILEDCEAKGVNVFYDADENSHLVPQSFLDYLAEKKEKK
ncbi:hypothetical protein JCM3765_000765 [Sporobolomyces pararoseus]